MSNIFVSYSSKDRELVKSVAGDLTDFGNKVWWDRELTGGHKWWDDILEQIRQCDLFIFALTPRSLASDPCRREYTYASALNKCILPVKLADVDVRVLPPQLSQIQFVDYSHPENRDTVKALGRALTNLPPPQPLPDPLPTPPDVPEDSTFYKLDERVSQPQLSFSEQTAILFEIKALFKDPDPAVTARNLLEKLRKRPDLFASVAEDIDAFLRASPPGSKGNASTNVPPYQRTTGTTTGSSIHTQTRTAPAAVAGNFQLAELGQRVGAALIDWFLLAVVVVVFVELLGPSLLASAYTCDPVYGYCTYDSNTLTGIVFVIWAVIDIGYTAFFLSRDGQTIGKKVVKIKVVKTDGSPLTLQDAAIRGLGQVISSLIIGIGYLMAFADPERQALHDKIAKTVVVTAP